jgi:hypothetical protein
MSKEKFVRSKPHVTIGVLIAVFGLLSSFSLGMVIFNDIVVTLDSDGDTVPDQEEERSKRPLFFEVTNDLLSFRSYQTETSPTSVGHNLELSHDGLSTHLEIHSSLFNDVSTGVPLLEFVLKYESLIEFTDIDTNGYYDPGDDSIAGEAALTNMSRVDFGYGVDGQPSYYSGYSSIDGVLRVDFYTSREHILLGRQIGLLAPNELKSLLTFTNYVPLTGGTKLALKLSFNSSHNLIFSNTGLSVKVSTGNYKVEYEWYDWAIADGINTKVNITVPSSPILSKNGTIYINFGRLTNGTYDPKLSWDLPNLDTFNFADLPWTYFAIGSIALLMVATTTHVVRKKPGRVKYGYYTKSSNSAETDVKK